MWNTYIMEAQLYRTSYKSIKAQITFENWKKDLNSYFTKDIQMANKLEEHAQAQIPKVNKSKITK